MLSIDLITHELKTRGWNSLQFNDGADKKVRFEKNGYVWITRGGTVRYPGLSDEQFEVIKDKARTNRKALRVGANVPATLEYGSSDDLPQAEQFLKEHTKVVVKPVDSQGSQGVTIDIISQTELMKAIEHGLRFSDRLFIQQQYQGSEFRFTFVNNQLVSVLEKRKAYLTGDGQKNIATLLEAENATRQEINERSIITYPQLVLSPALHEKRETVPGAGELVSLSNSSLVRNGASLYEVIDVVDISYKHIAERIALAVGKGVIVVDMLIDDILLPAGAANYCFLECNSGPALSMYYSTRNHQDTPMLRYIGEWLDSLASGELRPGTL